MAIGGAIPRPRIIRFGPFELDVRAAELRKYGIKVRLHEQPFRILLMLLEHPGDVVLRDEIRQALWPNNTVVEFDHSINAAIQRLRDALGDSADRPRYVETVARRGYRFIGTVERAEPAPAEETRTQPAAQIAGVDPSDLSGQTLSHFRLIGKLGSGGMGVVYRAEDLKLGRQVAIKFLGLDNGDLSESARGRFETEARAAAALNHPNICSVYGLEEIDGKPAIVMELVEGETLEAALANGPFPLDRAVQVGSQIADALAEAHRKGVTHRDLKPANIMLTKSGAKVLDFGLAKMEKAGTGNTLRGAVLGSVRYMSPEQAEGKPADWRSDIYSFGLVLREMAPDAPALELALERCLAKDPADRWQSAADLKAALEWSARPAPQPAPRPAKARRGFWLVAGAAALLVAAAAGFVLTRPKPADPVAARFEVPLPAGAQFPNMGASTQWAPSPDGHYLAMVYADNSSNAIWLRPIESTSSRRLDKTEGANFPFWSPDSRYIGFFAEGKLKKLQLASGVVQPICDLLPDSSTNPTGNGATWNSEGIIVYSPDLGRPLYRVVAAGGKPIQFTQLDKAAGELSQGWPQFLPDGRHVMYHSQNADLQKDGIYVLSLGSDRRSLVMRSQTRAEWAEPGYLLFVNGSSLFAQRIDPRTFQLTGEPTIIEENVVSNAMRGRSTVAVSPTGTLVYRSSLEGELAWYDRAGKRTAAISKRDLFRAVRLSPDAKKAALVKGRTDNSDLWILDLATGAISRGTSAGEVSDFIGPWSPDSRIVLANREEGRLGVLEVESSAGKVRDLSKDAMWAWDWTRDGTSLLVTSRNRLELSTLPASGEQRLQVVSKTPYLRCAFRFSPDGKWVAYESFENSPRQIEVAAYPSFAERRQISVDGGLQPEWRADGKELFFLHNGSLMSVDIRLGEKIEPGIPKQLFQVMAASPDLSYSPVSDGSRFLFLDLDQRAFTTQSLVVVLNWTAELKRP